LASLENRCLGTFDSATAARIGTFSGTQVGAWYPASESDSVTLNTHAFEIFWFVNDAGPDLEDQTIVSVRRVSDGAVVNRLYFSDWSPKKAILTWEWMDMAAAPHSMSVKLDLTQLVGVWWHSIIQVWPRAGQPGSGWESYHGRTGVSPTGSTAPSDSMPYPNRSQQALPGGSSLSSEKLMGFRSPKQGYNVGFGSHKDVAGTGWETGTDLDGGFAEMRLWSGSFDPSPREGVSLLESRRSVYVRHDQNAGASGEGSGSVSSSKLFHCQRFNEDAAFVDVGQRLSDFTLNLTPATPLTIPSSPIQRPIDSVSLLPEERDAAASSSSATLDWERGLGLLNTGDLSSSSEAAAVDGLPLTSSFVGTADASASSDAASDILATRRFRGTDDLASSSETSDADVRDAEGHVGTDLSVGDESGVLTRAFSFAPTSDSAASSQSALTILASETVSLESAFSFGESGETSVLGIASALELTPSTSLAESSEVV